MTSEQPKKHVKIQFTKEEYKMLQEIREHYNLRTNTETIRLAIKEAYRIFMKREEYLEHEKEQTSE